jgi:hypothetical protein
VNRILYGLTFSVCLILEGCGGSPSVGPTPPPPAPPVVTPTIKIAAPADGTTVTGQPLTLSASFTTGDRTRTSHRQHS